MATTNLTTPAIILRRTNYGEADRILKVLTPEYGQQAVMAKSVRKERSKLAGGIELFSICELGLVRGGGNADGMWTLTSSRIVTFYDRIMTDYDRLQFGYEVVKRVSVLSDAIESPELYKILAQTLATLNDLKIDLRLIKIWFYLALSRIQGGELNLLTDSNGMKLVEGASYEYSTSERAFVYMDNNGRYSTETIKLLRVLAANQAWILAKLSGISDGAMNNALYLAQVAMESN